jgi:hypothetical protein
MVRTQVQLTSSQTAILKQLAAARHVSMAELIRQSVDDYVRRCGAVSRDERARRALAAAGRFHSGCGDLAVRHDAYLAEAYSE